MGQSVIVFSLNTGKLTFSPLIRHVRLSREIPHLPTHLYSDGCPPTSLPKSRRDTGTALDSLTSFVHWALQEERKYKSKIRQLSSDLLKFWKSEDV